MPRSTAQSKYDRILSLQDPILHSLTTRHGMAWFFVNEFENLDETAQAAINKRLRMQLNIESIFTISHKVWKTVFRKIRKLQRKEMHPSTSTERASLSPSPIEVHREEGSASRSLSAQQGTGAIPRSAPRRSAPRRRNIRQNELINTLIEFAKTKEDLVQYVHELQLSDEAQDTVYDRMMAERVQETLITDEESESDDEMGSDGQHIEINSKDPNYRCVSACEDMVR